MFERFTPVATSMQVGPASAELEITAMKSVKYLKDGFEFVCHLTLIYQLRNRSQNCKLHAAAFIRLLSHTSKTPVGNLSNETSTSINTRLSIV